MSDKYPAKVKKSKRGAASGYQHYGAYCKCGGRWGIYYDPHSDKPNKPRHVCLKCREKPDEMS
jgi:hypothetical protein